MERRFMTVGSPCFALATVARGTESILLKLGKNEGAVGCCGVVLPTWL